jgi:type 1 glutamine amidotransferase
MMIMKNKPLTMLLTIMVSVSCFNGCKKTVAPAEAMNILVMTGRNNHDWEHTTAVLDSILSGSGLFFIDVTTQPDTITYEGLKKYDALISNWNSWPETDVRWPEKAELGLLEFLEQGGGMVFFHSSSSAFYNWPEFKQISTGAWVVDSTWHGPVGPVSVTLQDRDHPITMGLADFQLYDELWINAQQNDAFLVLGKAINIENEESGEQPAIFVANYGAGRIFHTILGHDARAMRSNGFSQLMLRAAEWAASGQVGMGSAGQ